MKTIAHQLGVTVSTVSRALQNHPRIGLRTRERVHELAEQWGYIPNPTAINLKRKRTFNIGVVLPFLTEQFFSMAISGIEDVAISEGYSVMVMQSRKRLRTGTGRHPYVYQARCRWHYRVDGVRNPQQ